MAIVAHDFTHLDRTFKKGDEVDDNDPLVKQGPHLFELKSKKKAAKPATPDKKERP